MLVENGFVQDCLPVAALPAQQQKALQSTRAQSTANHIQGDAKNKNKVREIIFKKTCSSGVCGCVYFCPLVCLFVCLFACLFVCPSVRPSVHPSVHPSVRLSVLFLDERYFKCFPNCCIAF